MKDIIDIIKRNTNITNFNCIKIGLASPEQILSRSYGEIKKPETINYRTFKPERDGLFCAKIFGPIKDYECLCGKYKKLKHRGIICEKCGVEVTTAEVRRSRMASITLATPIAHIWFLKSLPSKIGLILDINLKDVEKILYFEQYVVIDPGLSLLKKGQLLTEEEYLDSTKQYGDEIIVKMGAEAIQLLLKDLNLKEEIKITKEKIKTTTSDIKNKKLYKRLKILELFINSNNKPEWMILNVLPVLPPDLRPLVPLDGGRFASSDLNDLYRRVINRNNRLKKLIDLNAPNIIIKNEKRMLQEAIDALIDNGRRGKTINGSNKRPLKSLADLIKGKQGRFRQNLLGKRVDYSGRSVIVVGPNLKLNQCGLPRKMAIELFKPFIFGELKKRNITTTIKSSKKMVEEEGAYIWDILNDIVQDHPVLLNRAPTLHRLGIQAFEPILIDGKAIQLHPLVCTAFNADFDGDQMAVHIPLTIEAQLEARILMMSTNNILSPANGEPIILPSQDIVLGLYYLSKEKKCTNKSIKYFKNVNDVEKAYENSQIGLHEKIKLKINNSFTETTCGRAILSRVLPINITFDSINKLMTKKEISSLISTCYKNNSIKDSVILADNLMRIGFEYATKSGISIGIEDIDIPKEKYDIIKQTEEQILTIEDAYSNGLINKEDRYNQIIDIWSKANENITKVLMKKLALKEIINEEGKIITEDSFNPIYMMAESGARGSINQIRQLAGMRGLMAKPDGSIIETPITANFREGLNILQYFISTHGARKGLADTALKTANSGYLTRRLVDVAQDVVITQNDCETTDSIEITPIIEDGNVIEKLTDRIKGRILQEDIKNKKDEIIITKNTLLNDNEIILIEKLNIKKIKVRSVIKCKLKYGVCSKCYGTDLTTNALVNIGEAVGVIAAQSIGEPGTQLTMRTFHIGGAASRISMNNQIQCKTDGILEYKNIKTIIHEKTKNIISISRSGKIIILDKEKKELEQYKIPYGAIIHKNNAHESKKDEIIATWDPHNLPIISEITGTIKYINLIEGLTIKKELDETTGLSNIIVIDSNKSNQNINNIKPCIEIINKELKIENNDTKITNYFLSPGTIINVENHQKINIGDIIAKIPKDTSKVKDITGGLPRVADIFEARKPKDPAILADTSGIVIFGKETKDKNRILIKDAEGNFNELLIPKWKNVNVFENENVIKGDILVEGEHNLHDILRLLGVNELTDHIKREVQSVYRLQGVRIDDKHIEVIIKQMLKKGIIIDSGESNLLKDDQENIFLINDLNKKLKNENKKEILYKTILLGITKAALTTDSFISAASFQETTKVLTEAAISGKKDRLLGLKENVIVGKLIPAGTGFHKKINTI
ncbi:DNA-directed RNA polymerase subunit beta' [Candidatus Azoamicus ciliaticola]|uniref:DNA-directed RNA polymerase subunit beta' n=1 Tax=Candidatus Azoamicus ciliaticola TaxID=2652803 RepID=A0A6J5JZK7_9GAMM|nr:DNA-directed RNA polymerase subunit beta' [Candidatus Azoamicus ciliaticola]CAB3976519.1 DNA-directed RNA polymerase subunit beta' [Candidatus Azoamicus ciliaticola]